ncbi:dihydroxyacetone kinase subunit L [candidate division WOR-3 bacterium]|nr:dihydroxyacetone kinase subunit L [candidate division WOR-3 bacterium]
MHVKLDKEDIYNILKNLSNVFKNEKDLLNDLDSKIGDGDHGLSMSRGFDAINKYLVKHSDLNISDILIQGGMQFNEVTGSTIGILIFSAMRAAGLAIKNKESIDIKDLKFMLEEAVKAIMKRGKASVGQKTMLDSLVPSLKYLKESQKNNMKKDEISIVKQMVEKAYKGVESTKQMESTIGRAKWFKNRSVGVIDPGAYSSYLIIKTIGDYIIKKN